MIKACLMHCFCILLRLLYLPFKALRPRNKAVFLSRQGNQPSLDFLRLSEELQKQDPELETVILCRFIGPGLKAKIAYGFHLFTQMYHLATARICILDGYCIAACVLRHHKCLRIYQIWHAVGLLKNFGYAAQGLREGSSERTIRIMRMHRGYHRILCSSEALIPEIARCYDAREEQFLPLGLPRLDFLTNQEEMARCKAKILSACPSLAGDKPIILYAPTFRKGGNHIRPHLEKAINLEHYHFIEKSHGGKVQIHTSEGISSMDDVYSGVEWISVADFVVSDYSAIMFEALAANRPVVLFCYDLEDYGVDRGFAIDYNNIPLPVCNTPSAVAKALEQYAVREELDGFVQHHLSARRFHSAKMLSYIMLEEKKGREISFREVASMEQFLKDKEVYHV